MECNGKRIAGNISSRPYAAIILLIYQLVDLEQLPQLFSEEVRAGFKSLRN